MIELPQALAYMGQFPQFILYKLVPGPKGKSNKIPMNPHTLEPYPKDSGWQQDPTMWADFATASPLAEALGWGVGFIFTENDPFFFLDIDDCLAPGGGAWNDTANRLCAMFSGAAVEVSSSGNGLHIFGVGRPSVEFSNRNGALGLEFYTQQRFVALTGLNAIGDSSKNFQGQLDAFISQYFPKGASYSVEDWTFGPGEAWAGPEDDDVLIEKMLSVTSGAAVFGGMTNLKALWTRNVEALATAYPDSDREFDESQADAALVQHLAFWTGNNCERIKTLMWRSDLVRDKWHREDYLERTILRATALQDKFYFEVDKSIVDKFGAGAIDASSPAQRDFAESIRAKAVFGASEAVAQVLCQTRTSAKFWLDNQDKDPEQLAKMLQPVTSINEPLVHIEPEIVSGYQYLGATLMIEKFKGCMYVVEDHKVLTPNGTMLDPQRFKAKHGGFVYQLDETGNKTTRNAFEAFTESQVVRFPKVDGTVFRPMSTPGEIFEEDGLTKVNRYMPVVTERKVGDASPFLNHLKLLLPDDGDRAIILAYMAACVQHKGIKFQWAPLIQGTQGNGKTLLTRCVKFAIGDRYAVIPKADTLTSNFNAWLDGSLFAGIEDIFVAEERKDILEKLKPMITGGDGYEIEPKGKDKYTTEIFCNFILNSNHKDAIRKTKDDRRFAVFFSAQQSEEDLIRDGMNDKYFSELYGWLANGGYAIVNDLLHTYPIPDALNPTKLCLRAPKTTSTEEAITVSLGGIEQEILEAAEQGRPGFSGGWISSVALEGLLKDLRAERAIPQNKRKEVMESIGYILHPGLVNGRVNNTTGALDNHKKPRLYVKKGHLSIQAAGPSEITTMYINAQTGAPPEAAKGGEVFRK